MPVLTFHQLSRRYGDVCAVEDLDFEVHPGLITAFLGTNGAGRTTSMRLLLGLSGPDAGSVTVDGLLYRSLVHPVQQMGLSPAGRDRLPTPSSIRCSAPGPAGESA